MRGKSGLGAAVVFSIMSSSSASAQTIYEHVTQRHPGSDWCDRLKSMPGAQAEVMQGYQAEIAKSDDFRSTRVVHQHLAALKCLGGHVETLRAATARGSAKSRRFAERLLRDTSDARESSRGKIRKKRYY